MKIRDVGNCFILKLNAVKAAHTVRPAPGTIGGDGRFGALVCRVINNLCRTGNSMIFNQLTGGNQNTVLNANLRINNCETMRKKQE